MENYTFQSQNLRKKDFMWHWKKNDIPENHPPKCG